MPDLQRLRIVHVTRTPVGGIFRHILDVASGQAARGHQVGIVCDSTTGGARAEAALAAIAPQMKLGVARFPMAREIGAGRSCMLSSGVAPSRLRSTPTCCTATAPRAAPSCG